MVRELKHTELGDIPADWKIQTFEETFKVLSNNTLSRENLNYRGGAVRNIHYGDILIKFSEVLNCEKDKIPYVNELSLLTSSTQLLQDGDIIIADTAEDVTVGKVTEVQHLADKQLVAGLHTIPCRVKKGDFAPGWLGYYMNSNMYHDQILTFVTGIKVSSISKSAIAETLILIPPKDVQENIVKGLSDVDELIRVLEKEIEKKKNFRYGMLQKYLSGEVRLQDFNSNWISTTLGNIADIKDGTHQTPRYVESGIPFYSVETVTSNDFWHVKMISREEHEQLSVSYRIEKGDVLMTRIGSLGNCKYINWDVKASFYVSLALLKFRGNNDLAQFISFLSKLKQFKQEVELHSLQFAIPMKINLGEIANIRVFIPSDEREIKALNKMFFDMEKNIELLQEKLDKYKKIKQGMMNDLLTGKIRLV